MDQRKKILVLDDEVDIREVFEDHFSARGYEVFTASNVEDGVKLAFQAKPDVVILDYNLRGALGSEFLKQTKTDLPDMKIIVVTGADDPLVEKSLRSAGADSFLSKGNASIKDVRGEVEKLIGITS